VEYLARKRALGAPEVAADKDLMATGERELSEAKDKFEKAVKRAFQHVAYLAQPNNDRVLEQVTFEDDNQTALDGTQVWKALVDREKAFDTGQFNARALVHHLREVDHLKPLCEIRDAFWSAPRLPLLFAGERDLQAAIFEAVRAGDLFIVDATGTEVAVTDPSQVNLGSTGLRVSIGFMARPVSADAAGVSAARSGSSDAPGANETLPLQPSGVPGAAVDSGRRERFVAFPLVGSMLDSPDKAEALAQVFRVLYAVLEDHRVSYAQGTVQLVVDAAVADRVAEAVRKLGVNVTIRDQ
jgi:hypothetical protein